MESSNTLLLLATLSVACTNDSQLGRIDRDEDITEDTTVPAALPDPDYPFVKYWTLVRRTLEQGIVL